MTASRRSAVLELRSSPHATSGRSVESIMWNVVGALVPTALFAIWAFGLQAAAVIVTGIASCAATEAVLGRNASRSTLRDGSVVITGLLLALTLPPSLPLWIVAVGGVFGTAVGKTLFGGLGANLFNPALVGRAFLQAAFPIPMTTWTAPFAADRFAGLPSSTLALPFGIPTVDVLSGPTALSAWKFGAGDVPSSGDLALGLVSGSTGETSAVLILLGGLWLAARKMLNWRIPVGILWTVGALSAIAHAVAPDHYPSAAFMLTAGGLMLGAVFMATDMVASPMTSAGVWAYGVFIGLVVVVIRWWGGMPEGVMYAILLGNAVSPWLDRWFRPRPFGSRTTPASTEASS